MNTSRNKEWVALQSRHNQKKKEYERLANTDRLVDKFLSLDKDDVVDYERLFEVQYLLMNSIIEAYDIMKNQ